MRGIGVPKTEPKVCRKQSQAAKAAQADIVHQQHA
ncbi:hypothetical protein LAUMK4_01207 [Mycobacterium persicum]|uniref:Uncharacterized protein n=1 Tax=Mycobacterium persicum TaxID=1487726 RepID=A0AB38UPL3_9MYCO|nr:hypothetical protein LAUMK15_01564 [Mycobacterium persicum]VAZ82613.1 hypothetical protein LAUMK42_01421 [Mycobacterium persicum]VAZ89818.1 hypothetical protein LAUMK4_01207 [Mycobacterium persicum]